LALASAACFGTNAPSYVRDVESTGPIAVVRPFATDLAQGGYAGPTDFGELVAEYVAGALQEQGIAALLVQDDAAPMPPSADIEIRGTVLRLDPESPEGRSNGRYRVGAGLDFNAMLTASAEAFDVVTGRSIGGVGPRGTRSNAWQGEEDMLRRCAAKVSRALANDLRNFIVLSRRTRRTSRRLVTPWTPAYPMRRSSPASDTGWPRNPTRARVSPPRTKITASASSL
jgi:hypothetical protein